jgi:hypothetical protein
MNRTWTFTWNEAKLREAVELLCNGCGDEFYDAFGCIELITVFIWLFPAHFVHLLSMYILYHIRTYMSRGFAKVF